MKLHFSPFPLLQPMQMLMLQQVGWQMLLLLLLSRQVLFLHHLQLLHQIKVRQFICSSFTLNGKSNRNLVFFLCDPVSFLKRAATPLTTLGIAEYQSPDHEQLMKRLRPSQPVEEVTLTLKNICIFHVLLHEFP